VLEDMIRAFGLMLVFEGVLPFITPKRWQGLLSSMTSADQRNIRAIGLASMLLGLSLLIFMR
jgi:uncharacterized protein YjeT (DUF2065 family)